MNLLSPITLPTWRSGRWQGKRSARTPCHSGRKVTVRHKNSGGRTTRIIRMVAATIFKAKVKPAKWLLRIFYWNRIVTEEFRNVVCLPPPTNGIDFDKSSSMPSWRRMLILRKNRWKKAFRMLLLHPIPIVRRMLVVQILRMHDWMRRTPWFKPRMWLTPCNTATFIANGTKNKFFVERFHAYS